MLPGFEDELWAHFSMLPLRYALDVNTERAEDVIMHKKLLNLARNPLTSPAVDVHLVQLMEIIVTLFILKKGMICSKIAFTHRLHLASRRIVMILKMETHTFCGNILKGHSMK